MANEYILNAQRTYLQWATKASSMAHEYIFNDSRRYLQRNKGIISVHISKYEGMEAHSLI